MNTIKGLNAMIRYFAWGAVVGALMIIGALIFGFLRGVPGGVSFVLGGMGLLVAFTSLREVRRGRTLKAKLLQTGATQEQSSPRNGHMERAKRPNQILHLGHRVLQCHPCRKSCRGPAARHPAVALHRSRRTRPRGDHSQQLSA